MNSRNFFLFIVIIITGSCSTRNLVYMSDLPVAGINTETIKNDTDPKIQPIDLLRITVSTLNPESNLLFNSGVLASLGPSSGGVQTSATQIDDGYRVDKNGNIHFPILGKIEVAGLTLEEATEKMVGLLNKEAKNPIVNIKLINFRITVIGEVNRPSTFPIATERITIIEAIGLAGDLTPFGKRENVLLLREVDGNRTTVRLNLNNQKLLDSPYFYLKQNDVVYVEPVRARAEQASLARSNLSIVLSIASLLVFIFLM